MKYIDGILDVFGTVKENGDVLTATGGTVAAVHLNYAVLHDLWTICWHSAAALAVTVTLKYLGKKIYKWWLKRKKS